MGHGRNLRCASRFVLILSLACLSIGTAAVGQVGSVIEDVRIDSTTPGLPSAFSAFSNFGAAIAGLGDLNGDGKVEVAAGTPGDDTAGIGAGAVQLLSLQPDGSILGGPEVVFSASVTVGAPPLSVTYTSDTSAGTTAWDWDFGDGSTSTLQHPTLVYTASGTYDVILQATCSAGVQSKSDYIVVVTGNEASVSSNNGSGVSPDVLTSLADPELGQTWVGQVDAGSAGVAGLTSFVGYENPLNPGINTSYGELLIDPGSVFAVLDTSVVLGGIATHDLVIPSDVNQLGFTFSGQVLLNSVAGFGASTNQLDFLLGL